MGLFYNGSGEESQKKKANRNPTKMFKAKLHVEQYHALGN